MAFSCSFGSRTKWQNVPPLLWIVISAILNVLGLTSSPRSTPPISRRPAALRALVHCNLILPGRRSFIARLPDQLHEEISSFGHIIVGHSGRRLRDERLATLDRVRLERLLKFPTLLERQDIH